MRHSKRTADEAAMAFDILDRFGIGNIVPAEFQPMKFGGRTFGQFEAIENKLGTSGVDQILGADKVTVTVVDGHATVEVLPKAGLPSLASFFQATKLSESKTEALFHVRIKRGGRTGQQLLDLTGRRHYGPSDVPATMPLIGGAGEIWEEFDYLMYKSGKQTPDSEVEATRTKRELKRDLEVQILINALFLEFADQHPNGDSWQDAIGNWCFADFYRGDGERLVLVDRCAHAWHDDRWFGGRKPARNA